MLKIGVLTIQGAIKEHQDVITRNNALAINVRTSADLVELDAIVLPGGESTVMRKLLDQNPQFKQDLYSFLETKPVYATCAGTILLSNEYYGIIDIDVIRNGFGSQIASETAVVKWQDINPLVAFIRAPLLVAKADQKYITKAYHQESLVGLETETIIAVSFHPELTEDDRLFKYFLEQKVINR